MHQTSTSDPNSNANVYAGRVYLTRLSVAVPEGHISCYKICFKILFQIFQSPVNVPGILLSPKQHKEVTLGKLDCNLDPH